MDEVEVLMRAPVTTSLLIANIVLSVSAFSNVRLLDRLMLDVNRLRRFHEYWRLVTSGFIHGDPLHLFFNMYALYIFGPIVEQIMGSGAYLGVYMASLLAGSLWAWLEHHRDVVYRALGASGAISGVTCAGAMFFPFATIKVFFILPMPLIVFAMCYIGWSIWASRARLPGDNIGHEAHLGGSLMGVALICLFWPEAVRNLWTQFLATLPTSL